MAKKKRSKKDAHFSDDKLRPGANRCRCATCGEYFNGEKAFDMHRIGEYPTKLGQKSTRRCRTWKEMIERGMVKSADGYWITEAMRAPAAHRRAKGATRPRAKPDP